MQEKGRKKTPRLTKTYDVKIIPATVGVVAETEEPPKKRVAAYCRVSTDQEAQETSLEEQMAHFNTVIAEHPDWELAGIYADEGISGTQVKHRVQFQQMIEDAKAKKIDLILTKSISRFARNVVDSVYGIIDDCGFTSTLDVIKQNNNKKISKYIPKNLLPTMLNVGTKIWGSFDLSDADACKALAHTDIPLLIIHGDEDMQAPLSMAYKLYDSCNGEKQLYIVHGADHSENYRKDPGGYEKVVTKFIEERLRQKKCQTPGTKL